MFAMDNIIRRAVQAAITILIPGELQLSAKYKILEIHSFVLFLNIYTNHQEYVSFIFDYDTRIKLDARQSEQTDIHCQWVSTPELQTHFGPASECEGAEKDDEVDEEEAEFGPVLASNPDALGTTVGAALPTISTINSTHSQESQRSHNPLGVQLGRLKLETNR